jgi:hypothetical protein
MSEPELFKEIHSILGGKVGPYILLKTVATNINLDMDDALDFASSLSNQNLIILSPNVSGSDDRIVRLTAEGKRKVEGTSENNIGSKQTTNTMIITGPVINSQISQDSNNNQYNPMMVKQNLLDFVNKVKNELDSYDDEIKNRTIDEILNFTEEYNKDEPDPNKLLSIGKKIWEFVKPIASAVLVEFVTNHLEKIFSQGVII